MSLQKRKNKKITVSLIIPTYNQAGNLDRLLLKLASISQSGWEIIVVDDASSDNTAEICKKFSTRYYRFRNNQGPAKSRNKGAELSKGNILVFLDADVMPYKHSIHHALKLFNENSKLIALSGIWSKTQDIKSFFCDFKALRDWSYYFHEAQSRGTYFFNTRVGIIRKHIFVKLSGFNTSFKKADLESMEFSFRLKKHVKIHFSSKFIVKHQFEAPWTLIKNYFKRTIYFIELFRIHRQFGKVVATQNEALSVFLAASLVFIAFMSFFYEQFILLLPLISVLYFYRTKAFLSVCYSEKSMIFAIKAFFFNLFLHLVIFSAVLFYFIKDPLKIFSFTKP